MLKKVLAEQPRQSRADRLARRARRVLVGGIGALAFIATGAGVSAASWEAPSRAPSAASDAMPGVELPKGAKLNEFLAQRRKDFRATSEYKIGQKILDAYPDCTGDAKSKVPVISARGSSLVISACAVGMNSEVSLYDDPSDLSESVATLRTGDVVTVDEKRYSDRYFFPQTRGDRETTSTMWYEVDNVNGVKVEDVFVQGLAALPEGGSSIPFAKN